MKAGSFISSIITFILSAIATYACSKINDETLFGNGGGTLAFLLLPIKGILYCFLAGFLLSTFLTSISAISSPVTAIRVISVIILVVTVVLTIYNIRIGFTVYRSVFG